MLTQEQIDKLPNKVKNEITTLQWKIKDLEKRLSEFSGEVVTNTSICEGLEKKPLPNYASIDFCTGENNLNKVSVRVSRSGYVDVNTDSRLGLTMVIIPRAANSFYIDFVKN